MSDQVLAAGSGSIRMRRPRIAATGSHTTARAAVGVLWLVVLAVRAAGPSAPPPAAAQPTDAEVAAVDMDRAVLLLRDPAVQKELGVTGVKAGAIRKFMDRLDGQMWALGSLSPKEANAGMASLLAEVERESKTLLSDKERARFAQIVLQWQGLPAVLKPTPASSLSLSNEQQGRIRAILASTWAALKELEATRQPGPAAIERAGALRRDQAGRIWAILTARQREAWERLIGPPFDRAQVKPLALRAPELRAGDAWLNTRPLTLEGLRGRVVVLHFFTYGCVNCVHNYPAYKAWMEKYEPRGLTFIGIHTPESQDERDLEKVRSKTAESGLTFPILVDNDRKNWTAWGNNIWPSVYLIDKQGFVRHGWAGELNWQGAGGQAFLAGKIEELLLEP